MLYLEYNMFKNNMPYNIATIFYIRRRQERYSSRIILFIMTSPYFFHEKFQLSNETNFSHILKWLTSIYFVEMKKNLNEYEIIQRKIGEYNLSSIEIYFSLMCVASILKIQLFNSKYLSIYISMLKQIT